MNEKLIRLKLLYNQKGFLYHIVNDISLVFILSFLSAFLKLIKLNILSALGYLLIIFILVDITVRTCQYIVKEEE